MAWVPYRSLFDAENVEFWVAPTSFDDNRIVFEGVLLPDGYRNLFSAWCGLEDVLVRMVLEDGASADAALPGAVLDMGGNTTPAFPNAGVVEPFDHEANIIANWEAGAVVSMRPQVPYFTDIEFTGTFQIYIWSDAPDPEPVGCFWTDLVNATQVCGAAPPEPSGLAHFWGTDQNGDGSAYGRVAVTYRVGYSPEPDSRSPMMCSTPMFEALIGAEEVSLTGYAVADGLEVVDTDIPEVGYVGGAPAGYDTCQVPVDPDTVPWTSADYAMTLFEFGNTSEYRWFNDESLSQYTWYYVRINVDGTSYYGVIYVGGGI